MTTSMQKLQELVAQLQARQLTARDFIVDPRNIQMTGGKMIVRQHTTGDDGIDQLVLDAGVMAGDEFTLCLDINEVAHDNLSARYEIPSKYYQRLREEKNTPLFDHTLNHWMYHKKKNLMIRTFLNNEGGGICRAVLSDRYKRIDNLDVLLTAIKAINDMGMSDQISIEDAQITDRRMYAKFVNKSLRIDSPVIQRYFDKASRGAHQWANVTDGSGGTVYAGFELQNSETGFGSGTIIPRPLIKVCNNGAMIYEERQRHVHIGGKQEEGALIQWSEETKQKELALICEQVKDAVRAFLSVNYLNALDKRFQKAEGIEIEDPVKATEKLAKAMTFTEDQQAAILKSFCEAGNFNNLGMAQAVTFIAQAQEKPDDRFEMERQMVPVLAGDWN